MLRLYNTLTKTKEDFVPLDPKNVRMYVCGPTVYDYAHIGNARPAIVFDVVFRLLRHLYGDDHVTYVRNITDVDDKINARALEISEAKKIPIEAARLEITEATTKQYLDDVAALGCLPLPEKQMPRATEYIRQMILMIEMLIKKGHAYEQGGHVLYDVGSKKDYGKLSRRSVDDMIAGARVDVAPYKANPMDFVLWKPSTPEQPGWEHNKWGRGRPGWHIECSAMADALLGETFDIHGGGIDLIFPHHENEIAQSEGAHADAPPARYWMHNGFLQVEGEKMSKSLGNFITIRELLRNWNGRAWSGGALRLAMLQTHYRQPINWTSESVEQAHWELSNWVAACASTLRSDRPEKSTIPPTPELEKALCDDLNTPEAVAVLRAHHKAAKGSKEAARALASDLQFVGILNAKKAPAYISGVGAFGAVSSDELFANIEIGESLKAAFLNNDTELESELRAKLALSGLGVQGANGRIALVRVDASEPQGQSIEEAIEARLAARKAKDWKESDRIRDELLAKGIQLKDNPDGTTSWEVKR